MIEWSCHGWLEWTGSDNKNTCIIEEVVWNWKKYFNIDWLSNCEHIEEKSVESVIDDDNSNQQDQQYGNCEIEARKTSMERLSFFCFQIFPKTYKPNEFNCLFSYLLNNSFSIGVMSIASLFEWIHVFFQIYMNRIVKSIQKILNQQQKITPYLKVMNIDQFWLIVE